MSDFNHDFANKRTSKGQSSDLTDGRKVYSVTDIHPQKVPSLNHGESNMMQTSFGRGNPTKLSTVMAGDSNSQSGISHSLLNGQNNSQ